MAVCLSAILVFGKWIKEWRNQEKQVPFQRDCSPIVSPTGNKYKILSLLGKGGVGVVYEVEDLSKQIFAAKCSLVSDASRRESEIIKKITELKIPNVPQFVEEFTEGEDYSILIMSKNPCKSAEEEFITPLTGKAELGGRPPFKPTIIKAHQLFIAAIKGVETLGCLEKQGIAHGDINLRNISFNHLNGDLKIFDFSHEFRGTLSTDLDCWGRLLANLYLGYEPYYGFDIRARYEKLFVDAAEKKGDSIPNAKALCDIIRCILGWTHTDPENQIQSKIDFIKKRISKKAS